jgi:hypothetical protein
MAIDETAARQQAARDHAYRQALDVPSHVDVPVVVAA